MLRPLAVAMAIAVGACGPSPSTISDPVRRGAPPVASAAAEAENLWSERLDVTKLRAAIDAWHSAVATRDDDARSWLMLARAHYFLGDGFLDLEHAPNDEVTRNFEDGAACADRGLRALSPTYESRRQGGMEVDEAAAGLGIEAVPFVYWWGLNAIRWADRAGWTAAARIYKHVLAVMAIVEALDPGYDHAGAERYLGAFYSAAPGLAGGDTDKGKKYLDRALEREPHDLSTWIVVAERYAAKIKDQELYDRARTTVLETPSETLPDAVPEQEIAKKKARRLRAKVEGP
jgi:tetratricopeptide (TPR) repeat protein